MTNSSHDSDRLSWTALGVRMGFTSEQQQREENLAAVDHMAWIATPARPPYLDGPAVRAIVNAVFHQRRDQLHLVGIARLNGGRQLIGLEDTLGTRSYVLDLDAEAIYVLAEFNHPLIFRSACLHCDWEGETRDDNNGAVDDAHDHAWPGWRDLPIVARRPEPRTNARQKAATARRIDAVNDVYPNGWLESAGPIGTARGYYGTRHVPADTGFGGYDLCGESDPEPVR